jgi:hypothetical protein
VWKENQREKPSIEKVTVMSKSIYSKGILIVEDSKEYALSPIPSLDSAKFHSN